MLLSPVVAPPEKALTVAVPDWVPAWRMTVTLPPVVRASRGSSVPSVVEKVTSVPL